MAIYNPDFGEVAGDLIRTGNPPPFTAILRSLDRNPQLVRWTAVRAQRDAELLSARLKPIPDLRLSAGWRHYRETGDNAVRLGVAVALRYGIRTLAASQKRAKRAPRRMRNRLPRARR